MQEVLIGEIAFGSEPAMTQIKHAMTDAVRIRLQEVLNGLWAAAHFGVLAENHMRNTVAEITDSEARAALDIAAAQVKRNLPVFSGFCQNHSSVNGFYPVCENVQWTCGFWPGEIWLCYEYTGEECFLRAGESLVLDFLRRVEQKIEVAHHDMGFLYSPSCVASYKLTGNDTARRAAILAADRLLDRFQEIGEFFQAWGSFGVADNYRFIIDCLMNMPLLFWAGDETGSEKYSNLARRHIATCFKHSIRPDGSTYHTVFMNPKTGAFTRGATCQGYRDDSFWARGQAWAVYGTAICLRYLRLTEYRDVFLRCLDFYLSRLPDDLVPYWDQVFSNDDGGEAGEPRDSSSASIVVCGLLEAARIQRDTGAFSAEDARSWRVLARRMLKSLADNYAVKDPTVSNGIVAHATYSKKSPYNTCTQEGVDECVSWGDYFYMEALTRLLKDWDSYW